LVGRGNVGLRSRCLGNRGEAAERADKHGIWFETTDVLVDPFLAWLANPWQRDTQALFATNTQFAHERTSAGEREKIEIDPLSTSGKRSLGLFAGTTGDEKATRRRGLVRPNQFLLERGVDLHVGTMRCLPQANRRRTTRAVQCRQRQCGSCRELKLKPL
jgi:hypothetical protein